MSGCRRRRFVLLLAAILLLAAVPHSHGRRGSKKLAKVEYSEQQFMKWVDFVGNLNHSVFKSAKNKLFPSYTLTVDKNPARGDFTTIQDAVDSLPAVNLVRVVISVHAGVYSSVFSLSLSL